MMLRLTQLLALLFVMVTLHPRAAAQCTAGSSEGLISALADFQGRQPIPLDFDSTYCVNTDDLLGFTGQVELTTDLPMYPFRVTITQVSSGSSQLLEAFGDQANLNSFDLYTVRFEALRNGTADATLRVGALSTPYTVIVGTGLPVVWEQPLRYEAGEKKVDFSWSVSAQEDVAGYELERSLGDDWQVVSRQPPLDDAGLVRYVATDNRAARDAYYRIRQLDLDGGFSLSNVVSVPARQTLAYPNPTAGRLTLPEGTENARAWLVDAAGRRHHPVRNGRELDVTALASGVYILLIEGSDASQRIFISH